VVEIPNVAVIVVEFTTVTALTVTPPPPAVTVAPVAKFVPVMVTGTLLPREPEFGLTPVTVGAGGRVTVNVTAGLTGLVPDGVVMVTFLADRVAVVVIAKIAVTCAESTTVIPLAVTPVPDTFTAVAPVRLVPVRVTGILVPRAPRLGAIDVSVGDVVLMNSTAPASTELLVFLEVP
jgi:hypothetical protein